MLFNLMTTLGQTMLFQFNDYVGASYLLSPSWILSMRTFNIHLEGDQIDNWSEHIKFAY
jgi:hypothetical protein